MSLYKRDYKILPEEETEIIEKYHSILKKEPKTNIGISGKSLIEQLKYAKNHPFISRHPSLDRVKRLIFWD